MKDILRQLFVVLTVILTITVNALANILPINGHNTGQISDGFKVYFVPAGYVFSIWGLIYIGLIAFAVYQALPSKASDPNQRAIGWWFGIGGLANSAWIFAWHYLQIGLSVAIMLVLLASLLVIYIRLYPSWVTASRAQMWAVHIPGSGYLGWITVATVANITAWLYSIRWNGFGLSDLAWMGLILAVVAILTGSMNLIRRDGAYAAVILWALAGIAIKFADVPFVLWSTLVVFAFVLISLVYALTIAPAQNRKVA